jgi:hypothetical protein
MKYLGLEAAERKALLRAMITIATANGRHAMSKLDRSMIEGLEHHLLHTYIDISTLTHIGPDELASKFRDLEKAETALQFLTILSYTDTTLDVEKLGMVDAYGAALGVSTDTLELIHLARDNQVKAMEHCIYRKLAADQLAATETQNGFKALKDAIGQRNYDMGVASRYQRLGLLPENSLGRSIWEFYRLRNFAFPGEGTIDETASFLLVHDTCHVLGGYNSTVEGEITVGAFQAGMTKKHSWMFAVVGVLDFHMGIDAYTGPLKPQKGFMDPEKFTAAFERGLNMTVDIQSEWNLWERMDQNLDDLRREANIIGAENIHRHLPEGWWEVPREGWWPKPDKITI